MFLISSIYYTAIKYTTKLTLYGLKTNKEINMSGNLKYNTPSTAYIMATWVTLGIGILCYLIGIWNSGFPLNEKGYYLSVFILGLFAAVTLQKTVRDKEDGIPTTNVFVGICWFAFGSAIFMLVIGLFNADILLSEKGFFGIAFLMSLFAIITVQKNIRDMTDEYGNTHPNAFPKNKDEYKNGAMEIIDKL